MTAHQLAFLLLAEEDLPLKIYTGQYFVVPESIEEFDGEVHINIDGVGY